MGAPAAVIPPGVPEPGLVLWGTVVNQTNNQPVTVSSAAWSVTDGSKTAVYSSASRPPTRVVNSGGQSFYILQVPFDTRQIGTVTLADPATVGVDSFILRSTTPPVYTLVPTINGALATVRSIDGAPASGGQVPVSGFSTATRGRVIRVDLAIIPVADDYDSWAVLHFGSASLPQAQRDADPDDDGMTNEDEHAAGTDPNDPNSLLRILALTLQAQSNQAVIGWQSVSSRSYLIESAAQPEGPWSSLGTIVPGIETATQRTLDLPVGQRNQFYRVRLAP